jgi:uncharacterized protein (TIGR02996 family)
VTDLAQLREASDPFLRAIDAADDPVPAVLVYADWCDDRGYGEFASWLRDVSPGFACTGTPYLSDAVVYGRGVLHSTHSRGLTLMSVGGKHFQFRYVSSTLSVVTPYYVAMTAGRVIDFLLSFAGFRP